MISVSQDILLEVVLKSAAVTALALGLVTALKRLPASQRALTAHLGLLVAVTMPLLVLFGPRVEVAGLWTRDAVATAQPVTAGEPGPMSAVIAAQETVTPVAPIIDAGSLLLVVWFAGAVFLASGLGLGLARLFRLRREASVLTDRDWLGALAQAQHRMGVKQGTALLRSELLGSPVSWGLLRPTIVLSAGAVQTPDRAEAILAHELAHVVRMDWLNLLIARVATAVFWFNPLVWILARQAHELREEAADDIVLRGDVDGPDYAGMLVDFARGERGAPLAAHGVAPGQGSLKRRLTRVLDRGARRDPARPVQIAAGLLAAAVVAVPLAAFTPMQMRGPMHEAAERPVSHVFEASDPNPDHVDTNIAPSPAEEAALKAEMKAEVAAEPFPTNPGPRTQAGTGRLSPEALATMSLHGVTPEWIAALEQELPWVRGLSADQLTTLAIHGVTPAWARGMRGAGYGDMSYRQVTSMMVHGVDAAYVRNLAEAGLTNVPIDELVGLKIAGVDGNYARRMVAAGVTGVDGPRRSAPNSSGPWPASRSWPESPPPATAQPPASPSNR